MTNWAMQKARIGMFDFARWNAWLSDQVPRLEAEDFEMRFGIGKSETPKQGMAYGIIGHRVIGLFQNWITGEADYTIQGQTSKDMIAYRWGVIATDETFEALFCEFLERFRLADEP